MFIRPNDLSNQIVNHFNELHSNLKTEFNLKAQLQTYGTAIELELKEHSGKSFFVKQFQFEIETLSVRTNCEAIQIYNAELTNFEAHFLYSDCIYWQDSFYSFLQYAEGEMHPI